MSLFDQLDLLSVRRLSIGVEAIKQAQLFLGVGWQTAGLRQGTEAHCTVGGYNFNLQRLSKGSLDIR
jgi:hypothetical protein